MKKIIFALIFIALFLNAEDKFEKAKTALDNNKTTQNSHIGYMPDLITPENLKSGIYAGLGVSSSYLNAKSDIFVADNYMMDLSFVAGYNYNQYLSLESRFLVSLAYDDLIDFKSFGVYIKPQYEVYKNVNLYSLIGMGRILASSVNSSDVSANSSNFQVGIGANYKLKNNFKLFADYLYLGKDKNGKYNGVKSIIKSGAFTTGITYDF